MLFYCWHKYKCRTWGKESGPVRMMNPSLPCGAFWESAGKRQGEARVHGIGWPDYILVALLVAASGYSVNILSVICFHRLLAARNSALSTIGLLLFQHVFSLCTQVPRKTILPLLNIIWPVVQSNKKLKRGQSRT